MNEYEVVEVRPPRPDEKALAEWFAAQRFKSPEMLDAAARQIITLVTALLGLLFTILALSGNTLPRYVQHPAVVPLSVAAVVLLLVALIFALLVLRPRRVQVSSHDLTAQREAFHALLDRKAGLLTVAFGAFFWGVFSLGAILIIAILSAAPHT